MTFAVTQGAVVIDASVAVDVLQGEATWVARLDEWLRRGDLLLVPPIFRHEVANALLRSANVARDDILLRIPKLAALGIEVADRGWPGVERSIELADRHGLTVYDASYLELAMDVDAALATNDGKLRRAAAAEDVPLADEQHGGRGGEDHVSVGR